MKDFKTIAIAYVLIELVFFLLSDDKLSWFGLSAIFTVFFWLAALVSIGAVR